MLQKSNVPLIFLFFLAECDSEMSDPTDGIDQQGEVAYRIVHLFTQAKIH